MNITRGIQQSLPVTSEQEQVVLPVITIAK